MPAFTPAVRVPIRRPSRCPGPNSDVPPHRVVVGRRRAVRTVRPRLLDAAPPVLPVLLLLTGESARALAAAWRAAVRAQSPVLERVRALGLHGPPR